MSPDPVLPSVGIGDRPGDDLPAPQDHAAWSPSRVDVIARLDQWLTDMERLSGHGAMSADQQGVLLGRAWAYIEWARTLLTED